MATQILDWLKKHTRENPEFLRKIIGGDLYKILLLKFMTCHGINISAVEFAEMFWNECITTNESHIEAIKTAYNTEMNEIKRIDDECCAEIENHFHIVSISIKELSDYATFDDMSGFIADCFNELKTNVYNRYCAIYLQPHTYEDLINISEAENNAILFKIRIENERRDALFEMPRLVDVKEAPRTYTKHGFRMSHKELLRAVENKTCIICTSEYHEHDVVIFLDKCKHIFHKSCIERWDKKTCPICRTTN